MSEIYNLVTYWKLIFNVPVLLANDVDHIR